MKRYVRFLLYIVTASIVLAAVIIAVNLRYGSRPGSDDDSEEAIQNHIYIEEKILVNPWQDKGCKHFIVTIYNIKNYDITQGLKM